MKSYIHSKKLKLEDIEKLNDEDVVYFVSRDKEFFGVLIRRYEARLIKYVGRITNVSKDSLEDIVQNIFIKAYVNINSFKKGKKFGSWLYGIAHNECIDNWRKYKKHSGNISLEGNDELLSVLSSDENIEEIFAGRENENDIRKALDRLPIKFREVLVLKYLEDNNYEEIGYILKKPPSTIGTLLRRAKLRFKKILSENK